MRSHQATTIEVLRAILSNPEGLRVKPSLLWFFYQYLRKFRVIKVGGKLIIHSHLPLSIVSRTGGSLRNICKTMWGHPMLKSD